MTAMPITVAVDMDQLADVIASLASRPQTRQGGVMIIRRTNDLTVIRRRALRMWRDDGCSVGRLSGYLQRAEESRTIAANSVFPPLSGIEGPAASLPTHRKMGRM